MEVPAQQHGEVAEERLLLDHRLERDQHDAAGEHRAQQQQALSFLRPELRGLHFRQPVDDAAQHPEEQRLERADHRGEQRRGEQKPAHAFRARPQEREKAARRRGGRRLGIGIDQALEKAEHGVSVAK